MTLGWRSGGSSRDGSVSTYDDSGAATVGLDLNRFADATYAMKFYTEGFEADSGRSVTTSNSLLVSALPYVVGAKADGDFGYVSMGSSRAVEWIALDPTLKKIAVENLELRLIERVYVSVLSKNDEGSYVYEPPGETHTLYVPEDVEEMITYVQVNGVMYYTDPYGKGMGYEDVFTKIEMCNKHFEAVGLGADYTKQFIR